MEYIEYIGAPYNFVKLYKNVYKRYNSVSDLPHHDEISDDSTSDLPRHDEIRTNLLSGEITCKIKAETPIFISDGVGEFYKTLKGKYAIPGSSFRGLVSSNMSVLGFCSVGEDIADRRFMYRQIGGGNNELKERYKKVIWHKDNGNDVRNIIAGFIKNENGKYYICQASGGGNGGTNFYTLSEKYIHTQNFQYIHGEMMYNDCNFERTEQSNKNGKKVIHYKNKNENKRYIPYSHKVFYTLD